MKRFILSELLFLLFLIFISCEKNDDDQKSVKAIDYTIIGDTNTLISDFKYLNVQLKGVKVGDEYTYSYYDSLSFDLNNDSIGDFTFNYYMYTSRNPDCTCLPKGKVNVWITNKYNGAIICDSVKNTAIGFSRNDSVNVSDIRWCYKDSISIFAMDEFAMTYNCLIDWASKNYICFNTTDRDGIKQIGWINIALIEDYFIIQKFSISKK